MNRRNPVSSENAPRTSGTGASGQARGHMINIEIDVRPRSICVDAM